MESVEMFAAMPDELGADGGYRPAGWFFLVPPDFLAGAAENVAMQQTVGVDTRLLDDKEIAEMMPWLNPEGVAGVAHEPKGGYSGGAGRFRGGLALRRVIRPLGGNCVFTGRGERIRHRPWGIFGGSDGASGRFLLLDGEGRETPLDAKPANLTITPDVSVVVETPGAGGYGSPAERSPELLNDDRESGKFSASYIKQHYGESADSDD